MVSVYVPRAVKPVVLIVRVELPGAATGFSENDDVEPDGRPCTPRETLPVKPATDATVTVYDVDWPRRTELDAGAAEIEKSCAAVTTSVTDVPWVSGPPAPVTVSA